MLWDGSRLLVRRCSYRTFLRRSTRNPRRRIIPSFLAHQRQIPSTTHYCGLFRFYSSHDSNDNKPNEKQTVIKPQIMDNNSTEKGPTNVGSKDKRDDDDKTELTKSQKLMEQIKEAGIAGIISYGLWEVMFWSASIPLVVYSYHKVTGQWPDLGSKEDVAKLSAQAFVYVNFSRFAVPLRIGLALSTTPWVQRHIVDRFLHHKK